MYNQQTIHTHTSGLVNHLGLEEDLSQELLEMTHEQLNIRNLIIDTTSQSVSTFLVHESWLGSSGEKKIYSKEIVSPLFENKKGHPLTAFLGTWEGDDINKMLEMVHATRSKF